MFNKDLDDMLKKSTKITIVGYYGTSNFGDDLMLKSLMDTLSVYELDINII